MTPKPTCSSGMERFRAPQCTPTPNILTLSLNKTWEIAREPLHKEVDNLKTNRVGQGIPFSNQILVKRPNFGVISQVLWAIGGTKIEKWQKVSTGDGKFLRSVRDAQLNIKLKNVVHVDFVGSTFLADHLHLDTKSTVRIGQKLADSFYTSFTTRRIQ
ncbi:probable carbohydrate esterase At4g34215 [Carya illinoinensis]|uniref:probable carbohydrate esterase At4g34215 n=1 Tax=Carya illinoinensis TaxID=32201 RepID=UPI001C7229CB|nr:probable carbohydrate esterase At4g34215 [Carya illinoinensis]